MRTIDLYGVRLKISASECWHVMNEARVQRTYTASKDQINHDIGVYIFWGWNDKPIRIGKAVKARNRILQYGQPYWGLPEVIDECQHVSYIRLKSKRHAADLEIRLIKEHKPKFNKQHND